MKRKRKRNSKNLLGGGNLFYRLGAFLLNVAIWDITSENSKIKYLFNKIIERKGIENNPQNVVKLDENEVDIRFIEDN